VGRVARLASANPHKLEELRAALPGWSIELLGATAFPPETGETYHDNARAKARFGRTLVPDDVWVLGEDSGIEVEGLDGGPGVHSARFAGGDEVGRMLAALADVEGDGRRARYVCELVAVGPGGSEHGGTGTLEGRIAAEPHGREGFGYDPIFVPDGEESTVAELGNAWKLESSHRARAARALRDVLGSG
jgi:XTP/dITP diphosphohydrolase